MSRTCKCVLVGESNVGKTSLLAACPSTEEIQRSDEEGVLIRHKSKRRRGGELLATYWDPSTLDDASATLFCKYDCTVILCFALDDPESIHSLRNEFLPKFNEANPNSQKILVGTKSDLREQLAKEGYKYNYVTTEQGTEFMNEFGAAKYVECSSVTQEGMQDVFDTVLWLNFDRHIKGGKH